MSKQTLILLYGGRSAEREVSVLSAESVMRAVDYSAFEVKTYFITQSGDFIKTQEFTETPGDDEKLMTNDTVVASQAIKPSDIYEEGAVVFPVLHGPMGEDGSIQGFLETLKLPYVGTNVLSSSVAMDKIMTKHILEVAGVPQVAYTVFIEGEDLESAVAETLEKLTFPVFVKPANMGSSVGISKAENEAELRAAIAKYIDNKITMDIPAHVPAEVMTQMRAYAAKAFRALGGCGLARCDFFLTEDGAIYLNELNTMPGFTQWSMYPLLWENMGLSYSDLIKELVTLGQEMFDKRESHLI